jgi:DNA-binding transcriptional ArsR family regulator
LFLDFEGRINHFDLYRIEETMNASTAVAALAALAQEHRLALFRLLVQAGGEGMPAGAIADALGVPNSSLSFHLAQLHKAGLVTQERQHRSLIYRANYAAMNDLVGYLLENCCAGADCGAGAGCEPSAPQETLNRKTA